MTTASVREWDRQFRLVRVHHEHREEPGRLRLAGIGADAVAVRQLALVDQGRLGVLRLRRLREDAVKRQGGKSSE